MQLINWIETAANVGNKDGVQGKEEKRLQDRREADYKHTFKQPLIDK